MTHSPRTARPIDHVVLPVPELHIARERLTALGFTVAPDGRHPFGTENCCVFFADGTFLEPLAIAQREECEAAALEGNVFVARDQAYRFRRGDNGFSALVFGTENARGDHDAFVKTGLSAGPVLDFARAFKTPDGESAEAAFRIAFAADLRAPDTFFFTCEIVKSPKVDRGPLMQHANGAVGMAEIVLSEVNPTDFQYPVQEVIDQREVEATSFGIELQAANGKVSVMTEDGMRGYFGVSETAAAPERGLRLRGIVLRVDDIAATKSLLDGNGVAHEEHAGRLVVQPADGQGFILAFEATGEDHA